MVSLIAIVRPYRSLRACLLKHTGEHKGTPGRALSHT